MPYKPRSFPQKQWMNHLTCHVLKMHARFSDGKTKSSVRADDDDIVLNGKEVEDVKLPSAPSDIDDDIRNSSTASESHFSTQEMKGKSFSSFPWLQAGHKFV